MHVICDHVKECNAGSDRCSHRDVHYDNWDCNTPCPIFKEAKCVEVTDKIMNELEDTTH